MHAKAAGLYMICTISKHEAEAKGYADALMFDYRGYVAEATGANVFFVQDGVLHTPTPDCFLNGLTRQSVIAIAKARGVKVVERHIQPEEMTDFSECFLTGSAAEVTPVSEIGPYRFKPGALTETLMNAYADEVRGVAKVPSAPSHAAVKAPLDCIGRLGTAADATSDPNDQHRACQQQDDAGGLAPASSSAGRRSASRLARTTLPPAPGCAHWRRWPGQRPGTRIATPPRRQNRPAGTAATGAAMAARVSRLNSSSQASSNRVCKVRPAASEKVAPSTKPV